MKSMKHSLLLSVLLALSAMAAGQGVKTDRAPGYDFSNLHSFAVKIGTSWGNPIAEERVQNAVAQMLVSKGWTQAPEESAQALVVVHGATQQRQSLDTMYSGWGGWGWAGGMGTATTTTTTYTVGTLVVDIFDVKLKKLVFRGVAQGELATKTEKNEKKLNKALDKIFKDFPPEMKEGKD